MSTDVTWQPVSLDDARELLDLTSGNKDQAWEAIAEEQLIGAVDLYRRLGEQHIAWLSDEVGLGKTFVAMAVAALLRRQKPDARILYLLPSSRLLPKWKREIMLFSRRNIRARDDLLKTLQGTPARPLIDVETLHELALETNFEPDRDFLCTLGAFSFALKSSISSSEGDEHPSTYRTRWKPAWETLLQILPEDEQKRLSWSELDWDQIEHPPRVTQAEGDKSAAHLAGAEKVALKVAVAEVINSVLPDFDLVICDESHNLRHGLGAETSRNRMLSVALGGVYCDIDREPSHRLLQGRALERRSRRVLMVTATPFQHSFAELTRQAAVFGFTTSAPSLNAQPLQVVADLAKLTQVRDEHGELAKQRDEIVKKLIIRRLGTLKVGKEAKTRNQYRREFRQGGMSKAEDARLPPPKLRERLLLAMVQKRVLDVLRPESGSTGWSFQPGLLSSFESFGQTLETRAKKKKQKKTAIHEGEVTKDGRPVADDEAKALDALFVSYQDAFQERMPHPKLDEVAKAIASDAWNNGEKSLVFVRRVRTTEELATRITWFFDESLNGWISEQLPEKLRPEWAEVWRQFANYRDRQRQESGAARSLFGWYFRYSKGSANSEEEDNEEKDSLIGIGGMLATEGLQASRPWSVLLEDNPVLALFDYDEGRLRAWAEEHSEYLRNGSLKYAYINQIDGSQVRTQRESTSSVWFSSFQAAALDLIADTAAGWRKEIAKSLRKLRFPIDKVPSPADRDRFLSFHGEPADWLVLPTFFSELQRHDDLCDELWPSGSLRVGSRDRESVDLTQREQRMLMTAQLLRSGRSYLDLWLAVVCAKGAMDKEGVSLTLGRSNGATVMNEQVAPTLRSIAENLIRRLKAQRTSHEIDLPSSPLTAWLEIRRAQSSFETLRAVNFPGIDSGSTAKARVLLRNTLTGLEPAIALHGSSKTERAMEQFRMPGFPLVMVATSVVQEGVDLHTFCRKVVHYGIDGSATGTEQRNGRVDRRGSLISRLMTKSPSETIDVYFPHLRESLEPLQMAALFQQMNRFLIMANEIAPDALADQQQTLCAMSQQLELPAAYPPPYQEPLVSAYKAEPPASSICVGLRAVPALPAAPDSLGKPLGVRGITFSDPVQEGTGPRWRTTASLPLTPRRDQPLLIEVQTGIERGVATLVVESPVWPFEFGYSKKAEVPQEQAALAEVLRAWQPPPGTHLLSRQRSKNKINLYLRSEVPLPKGLKLADQVWAWAGHVATVADELEQRIGRAASGPVDGAAMRSTKDLPDHAQEAF